MSAKKKEILFDFVIYYLHNNIILSNVKNIYFSMNKIK